MKQHMMGIGRNLTSHVGGHGTQLLSTEEPVGAGKVTKHDLHLDFFPIIVEPLVRKQVKGFLSLTDVREIGLVIRYNN